MEISRDWVMRRLHERLSFLNRQLASTIRERAVASDAEFLTKRVRPPRQSEEDFLDGAMPFPGTGVAVVGKSYEEPPAPVARVRRRRLDLDARRAARIAGKVETEVRAAERTAPGGNRNREIARRLSQLNHQIIECTQSINDVRRAIMRRKEERKMQLKEVRKMINRKLPSEFWAAKELNYGRFVALHADLFRSGINLAADCGAVFPDRQKDFKKLPQRQREKLFTIIKEQLMS